MTQLQLFQISGVVTPASKEQTDADIAAKAAARRYSVKRCHRDIDGTWEKVEATDLPLSDARKLADELQRKEHKLFPQKTSWTIDLFILQLEGKTP